MRNLIVDAQVLQTPALKRGMGQYVVSLLKALKESGNVSVEVILNSNIDNEFTVDARNKLSDFTVHELPLLTLNQTKNTNKALQKNKKILSSWISSNSKEECTYLISSIFQAEIYSAFPDRVNKMSIAYDTIPLQLFKQYESKMRWGDYLNRFSILYESDKLLCISKTTASDLQVYANIDPKKVVLLNGGPGSFMKKQKPNNVPDAKFILMPTGNDIRKNNELAVEAFKIFNNNNENKYKLVITSFFRDEEKERLHAISPNIMFTGVVSENELAWYFANCESVLFPSLYEGLGMPLIEAMLFNKPIAASNIDVFREISDVVAYYFDPLDLNEMVFAIDKSINNGITGKQKEAFSEVLKNYTWDNTAKSVVESIGSQENTGRTKKQKIAVVGPHVTGSSAIGKFIAELHQNISYKYDVDYYYEKSPIDKILRPDILGHITDYKPIYKLTSSKAKQYKTVVYNIGNSNHHSITLSRALTIPGVVILHDLKIENVFKDLVERNIVGQDRLDAERELDKNLVTKSVCMQSLVSNQKAVIVHSEYAKEVIDKIPSAPKAILAQLAVGTPVYSKFNKSKSRFVIGLAGILAGIKGLETIENIAKMKEFRNDRILLFGLNFAEPGLLDRIRQLPNVEIATDLSDFEFQQNLKSLDLLVNYRTHYQGEASYATLEAMRYGIPVLVRGDFGWYSELPKKAVLKVKKESDIPKTILSLKNDKKLQKDIHDNAMEATRNIYSPEAYVNSLSSAIEG